MRIKWIYVKYTKQCLPHGTHYIAISSIFFYCHHHSYLGFTKSFDGRTADIILPFFQIRESVSRSQVTHPEYG